MTTKKANKILKAYNLTGGTVYWGCLHTEADLIQAAKEAYAFMNGCEFED